eukprot:4775763-Amphidinium_carterae.1
MLGHLKLKAHSNQWGDSKIQDVQIASSMLNSLRPVKNIQLNSLCVYNVLRTFVSHLLSEGYNIDHVHCSTGTCARFETKDKNHQANAGGALDKKKPKGDGEGKSDGGCNP